MAKLLGLLRRLRAGEDAATMAEYVLMAMLVGVACVSALTTFGAALAGLFSRAVNGLH